MEWVNSSTAWHVLDKNVNTPVLFDARVHGGFHMRCLGDIGRKNSNFTTLGGNALLGVLGGVKIDVNAKNLRPLCREDKCSCGAISPRGIRRITSLARSSHFGAVESVDVRSGKARALGLQKRLTQKDLGKLVA